GHPEFRTAAPNFRLAVLNDAGIAFLRRYWVRGRIEDLNRALDLWSEAVAATLPDAPARPMYLTNLGAGLRDRYARSGRLANLDQAIGCFQQAVAATPPDAPARPGRLTNLGNGLHDRYARSGHLADLKQAQVHYATACERGQLLAPEEELAAVWQELRAHEGATRGDQIATGDISGTGVGHWRRRAGDGPSALPRTPLHPLHRHQLPAIRPDCR
ncbi:MAG: hypothetical protein NZQ09_17045, partial [Chloroflexus sp.]|nr:hypothetical protein [Chloroflexus sp.]